jgi:hypothetical protein
MPVSNLLWNILSFFGETKAETKTPSYNGTDVMVGPFRSWANGTCFASGGNCQGANLTKDVWTVIGNAGYDIIVAAGIITIFVIIWGGIQYMLAGGDESKMTTAKKTIQGGVIGAVIAIASGSIVNFVLDITGGIQSGANASTGAILTGALNGVYFIVGAIAVIMIVYSGFIYIISKGDPARVKKAKTSLIWAIAGFGIALAAGAITSMITGGMFGK